MSDIENTIKERTKTCGEFRDITKTSYDLKYTLRQGEKFPRIPPYMVEAMDMIAHKLARIVQGDPLYIDHWRDIQGYARLVENELKQNALLSNFEKGH